jgi:hypothetical protein
VQEAVAPTLMQSYRFNARREHLPDIVTVTLRGMVIRFISTA